jgi:hypothetical protein
LIYGEKATFCRDFRLIPGKIQLQPALGRDPNRRTFRGDNAVCAASLTASPEAGTLSELMTLSA